MNWSREGKLIASGFGISVLVMGLISWISYQNATHLATSADTIKHTHEILEDLTDIQATLSGVESAPPSPTPPSNPRAQPLPTSDLPDRISDRQQALHAIATLQPTVTTLRRLLADAPDQQHRLTTLETLLRQRQLLLQTPSRSVAPALLQNRQALRQVIADLRLEEERSLEVWVSQSQEILQSRMTIELLGTLLSFLILFAVYGLLYQQLLKRQQAERLQQKLTQDHELSELKLQFFSLISHEFRTPLSVILGSAQLLKESLESLVPPGKLKSLYRIQTSARRLRQLLTDLLTLARADAGKLDYHPQLVELQSFCINLIEDIKLADQRQHPIQLIQRGDRTHAWLDEKLLYTILSNLLSNAVKYSPPDSPVEFILDSPTPQAVQFQVCDRGIGIPPDSQETLFEPFERGSNVSDLNGTGLGMAVIKKCLDRHQGQIHVESHLGQGSQFTIVIPQPDRLPEPRRKD